MIGETRHSPRRGQKDNLASDTHIFCRLAVEGKEGSFHLTHFQVIKAPFIIPRTCLMTSVLNDPFTPLA